MMILGLGNDILDILRIDQRGSPLPNACAVFTSDAISDDVSHQNAYCFTMLQA